MALYLYKEDKSFFFFPLFFFSLLRLIFQELDGRRTCDGVQGSNRQQRNDSQVDVQAEGLVDENGAGEHVRLRGGGVRKKTKKQKS